jgi:hypothetical protein
MPYVVVADITALAIEIVPVVIANTYVVGPLPLPATTAAFGFDTTAIFILLF